MKLPVKNTRYEARAGAESAQVLKKHDELKLRFNRKREG